MRELDKLLESTKIDELLDTDLSSFSNEEKCYLLERVKKIADEKCYEVGILYNLKDVELVGKLDDKLKLIDLALTLAYDSKSNYDDVFTQTRMWDQLIHTHLKKKNIVVPPHEKHSKSGAFVGAYVKEPLVGFHKWVASFDLTSLYPSIIIQWNISPECLVQPEHYDRSMINLVDKTSINSLLNREVDTSILQQKGISLSPNGQFYKNDKVGFMSEITEKMFADRQMYKKKMIQSQKDLEKETDNTKRAAIINDISKYKNLQLSKKVGLNSLFGASGTPYFRYYDTRLATSITTSGQLIIQWIANDLNDYLNKLLATKDKDYVIASDTDSIFLSLDGLVHKTIMETNPTAGTREVISFLDRVCENKIQPFIDKSVDALAGYLNVYKKSMSMKREKLADKGLWTAKKRYAINVYNNEGVEYAKPKLSVTGLEMIKSSTPSACREKLWQALDIIMSKTEDDLISFISDFRQEFRSLPAADIAFPRGVNGIEEHSSKETLYKKATPIHVRGSIIYNSLLAKKKLTNVYPLIRDGEKIKFIYLKEPNTIQSNVISFSQIIPKELDIHKWIDYDVQFQKSFIDPLKIILDSIGWKTEKVSSLEDFFT
jgi:DNA polymerase elongation subunit (family B)